MTKDIESYLVFEDYEIGNMVYERNYNFDKDEKVDLNFDFDAYARFSEEKDMASLKITCKIFEEEFRKNQAPFYLKVTIDGDFSCEGEIDIEGFQLNGIAILLPYLRSIITSFTAQSGIPPVILPPINVYNAFKKMSSDEES